MDLLFGILVFLFFLARAAGEVQRKRNRPRGEDVPPETTGWPPFFPAPGRPGRDFPPVNLPPWWEEGPEEALPPPAPAPGPGRPAGEEPLSPAGGSLAVEGAGGGEGTGVLEGTPSSAEGIPGGEGRTLRSRAQEPHPVPPAAAPVVSLPFASGRELARAVLLAEVLGPPRARRPHRVRF